MSRLLIVDDSPTIRKMIIASLRPLNATFQEAASGLEAIEQLSLLPFDAVTLDLNMPDMHGLEFLQFIRNHDTFGKIPVVVVTTRTDDDMEKKIIEAGANSYVRKPFNPAVLLQAVQKVLSQ